MMAVSVVFLFFGSPYLHTCAFIITLNYLQSIPHSRTRTLNSFSEKCSLFIARPGNREAGEAQMSSYRYSHRTPPPHSSRLLEDALGSYVVYICINYRKYLYGTSGHKCEHTKRSVYCVRRRRLCCRCNLVRNLRHRTLLLEDCDDRTTTGGSGMGSEELGVICTEW